MEIQDKFGNNFNEFILNVQMGNIEGASFMWKFGYSDTNTQAVENTIWNETAGLYPYPIGYDTDAKKLDITSDNSAADDGIELYIEGLDADGYIQSEYVAVGATTEGTYSRLYRMYNHDATAVQGHVDAVVTGTSTTVGHMSVDAQSTLQAFYTIPKGMTGFLTKCSLSVGSGKDGVVNMRTRRLGHAWTTCGRFAVYQNFNEADRPMLPVDELTDLEFRFVPASANTPISAMFGVLLLDNKIFGL